MLNVDYELRQILYFVMMCHTQRPDKKRESYFQIQIYLYDAPHYLKSKRKKCTHGHNGH